VKLLKIVNVVGARPNFMKIAPLLDEMEKAGGIEATLIHTGQHYDQNMSAVFFKQLGIPRPNLNLNVGSGSHAQRTAEVMKRFEPVLVRAKPDVVVVVGDVDSTVACALVAAKLHIPVAHVEAGLRSFDRTMPEEINRIVTDVLSDYLFATDEIAVRNLKREGIPAERIHLVGDVMIDTLRARRKAAESRRTARRLGLSGPYGVLTLHRPSNVDDVEALRRILGTMGEIAKSLPIVFSMHPRTRKQVARFGLGDMLRAEGLLVTPPLGYLDFLNLMLGARVVLTDSGSIQQETCAAGIPCITLRENTERPYTLKEGRNVLVGSDPHKIMRAFERALKRKLRPRWQRWSAAKRIVRILKRGCLSAGRAAGEGAR